MSFQKKKFPMKEFLDYVLKISGLTRLQNLTKQVLSVKPIIKKLMKRTMIIKCFLLKTLRILCLKS